MRIALAAPRPAATLDEGVARARALVAEAAGRGAQIVCFPEAYLPGLRGVDIDVPPYGPEDMARALAAAAAMAREHAIATIMGVERLSAAGRQIAAYVFGPHGEPLGHQAKTQLAPSEDAHYVPGAARRMFQLGPLRFGVAICHEGWRYPETVRWAAQRGAQVVFHPHHAGGDTPGPAQSSWGSADGPYYEKAMLMRSNENTIYFASVGYALRYQEAATSLITPEGACQAHLPYGAEGVLVAEIDLARATGLLARRYAPERYVEDDAGAQPSP